MFVTIQLVEFGFVFNQDSSLIDGSRFVFSSYIFMVSHRFMVLVVHD